ncbi:flavin reductase [Mesorhizobium kowhaii]|uniref:flavin reductase n=1 Tax=Mesorhizobium kowhaii TaxID=1300272 RepID=UPI0035EA5157
MTNAWIDAKACDSQTFRNMLGSFMTGVTVVATRGSDGAAYAFTANSFTSVSLEPPLVLVCLAKTSSSFERFFSTDLFSISVLGDWQRETSNALASRDKKVKALEIANLAEGEVPYVEKSLATMICNRDRVLDAGDHVILLGTVGPFQLSAGQPLCYYRGGYVGFGLALRELEHSGAPLVVGGLLEDAGRVLLCRRPGSTQWEVPSLPLVGDQRHDEALRGLFQRLGITAEATVLYSLFREDGERRTTMIFTVEASGPVAASAMPDGTEIGLFGLHDRPWEMIDGRMKAGMLRRFCQERSSGRFGIYYDTPDGGRIVPLAGKPQLWAEWEQITKDPKLQSD